MNAAIPALVVEASKSHPALIWIALAAIKSNTWPQWHRACVKLDPLSSFALLESVMSVYDQLKALNITLPEVAIPAAAYLPYMQTGNLVFLSGHVAKQDGKPWVGKLGENMTTEEGKLAARAIAIDLMGTLQHACGGDLNRVKRIVKVMSLVNSTTSYTEQHLVTNGCSELLGQVFGEAGKHARSAFGVAQIPMGCCVEIELMAELA